MSQERLSTRLVGSLSTLLVLMAALLSGCGAHGPQPLPQWLIHVPPPNVNPNATLDSKERQIISDLKAEDLRAGYASPETIAALAIPEIQEGRPLDAALLLAISSYTYFRGALRIYEVAQRKGRQNLSRAPRQAWDQYNEFIADEVKTFARLDFVDEIHGSLGVWEKKRGVHDQLSRGLEELARKSKDRRKEGESQLYSKIEAARTPSWNGFSRPALASAFLDRLKKDAKRKDFPPLVAYHMVMVPTVEFMKPALEDPQEYFAPMVAKELAARMSVFRADVIAALDSMNPHSRSNAAFALALNGDPADAAIIRSHMEVEKDELTKLVFLFALGRLEEDIAPEPLLKAALTCGKDEDVCDRAVQMIQWSPATVRDKMNPDLFTTILKDGGRSGFSRWFAAAILTDEGSRRDLSDRTISELLKQTSNANESISKWSVDAVLSAKQLDRAKVKGLLARKVPGRDALLYKLATLAEEEDLPLFLERVPGLEKQSDLIRNAVVEGLSRISHPSAEHALFEIFQRSPSTALSAAIALATRKDVDKQHLMMVADRMRGAPGAAVKLILDKKGGVLMLKEAMQDRRFMQRIQAVHLAGLAGKKDLRGDLWAQVSYSDRRYYPAEANLRHMALKGLLRDALMRAFKAADIKDYHGIETDRR